MLVTGELRVNDVLYAALVRWPHELSHCWDKFPAQITKIHEGIFTFFPLSGSEEVELTTRQVEILLRQKDVGPWTRRQAVSHLEYFAARLESEIASATDAIQIKVRQRAAALKRIALFPQEK